MVGVSDESSVLRFWAASPPDTVGTNCATGPLARGGDAKSERLAFAQRVSPHTELPIRHVVDYATILAFIAMEPEIAKLHRFAKFWAAIRAADEN